MKARESPQAFVEAKKAEDNDTEERVGCDELPVGFYILCGNGRISEVKPAPERKEVCCLNRYKIIERQEY